MVERARALPPDQLATIAIGEAQTHWPSERRRLLTIPESGLGPVEDARPKLRLVGVDSVNELARRYVRRTEARRAYGWPNERMKKGSDGCVRRVEWRAISDFALTVALDVLLSVTGKGDRGTDVRYIFADEAGCMEFARKQNVSKYFLLCTVSLDDCSLGNDILNLRRQLAWRGLNVDAEQFHASKDPEEVRSEVFELLAGRRFRIDATLLEKTKVMPHVRPDKLAFYKHAWYFHFKHCGPRIARAGDEILIHAASIGTNKERAAFRSAVNNVAQQVLPGSRWQTTFWSSSSDPCLQIADYCAWAIQRAYERGDDRRLKQIQQNVRTCFDLYSQGNDHYY